MPGSVFGMFTRLPVSMTTAISLDLSLASLLAVMDKKRWAFGFIFDESEVLIMSLEERKLPRFDQHSTSVKV